MGLSQSGKSSPECKATTQKSAVSRSVGDGVAGAHSLVLRYGIEVPISDDPNSVDAANCSLEVSISGLDMSSRSQYQVLIRHRGSDRRSHDRWWTAAGGGFGRGPVSRLICHRDPDRTTQTGGRGGLLGQFLRFRVKNSR
ncbi:unnamed protein product [Sphagnum tenellum]